MSLYKILGFVPNDIRVYELALVHKSSPLKIDENKWANNERLEYLGDAVLDLVVADILYRKYPTKREGFLTNTRSKIVQRETLDQLAVKIGLDRLVIFSTRMSSHSNHLYGNALEAFIGAIYLDQGYDKTYRFIQERLIRRHLNVEELIRKEMNFKSNLIEWSQKNKIDISFDLIESFIDNEGNPVFQTAISILGEQIGIGIGFSKKESQQEAAKMAVNRIRTDKSFQKKISHYKQGYKTNPTPGPMSTE